MNESIKFTVIVPTRERADTLLYCLRTLVAQNYENAEFLVSDNFSQDNTKEVVESFDDPRIRYINTGKRISMSHNWEFAIAHVTHGWVTAIGDDDGLLPNALCMVNKIINENADVKAIRSNGCSYSWPLRTDHGHGRLIVPLENRYEIVSTNDVLERVIQGIDSYTELPVLYNGGFVHFDLIRAAAKMNGRVFNSMSPDVYSGAIFALLTDKFIVCKTALAIDGGSHHGTGNSFFNSAKSPDPAKKFLMENNIPFHADMKIPQDGSVKSIDLLFYESYLQAARLLGINVNLRFQEMLDVVTSKTSHGDSKLNLWGQDFAATHQLQPTRIIKIYVLKVRYFVINVLRKIIRQVVFAVVDGTSASPIYDVHQAAALAGEICNKKYSFTFRMKVLRGNLKRIFTRVC